MDPFHSIPNITIDDYSASYDGSTSSARSTDESSAPHENQESSSSDEDEDVMEISTSVQDEQYELNPDEEQEYACLGTLMRKCGYRHCDKQNVRWFWPDELRKRILTRDRITKELQAYQESDRSFFDGKAVHALAETILSSHHMIFAILTLVDRGSHIVKVIQDGVEDKHLPLMHGRETWELYRTANTTAKKKKAKCFSHRTWGTHDRESFFRFQPYLRPAYLCFEADNRTLRHVDFDVDTVLPFTCKEQGQQGGFGSITKIKVHPKCHGFHGILRSIQTNDNFALKVLLRADWEEFQREVRALERFNGFNNQHMVTLLMTWTLDGQYNMLFPLAECDLDEYWQNNKYPLLNAEFIMWMSKQIMGIADALKHIHDPPFDPPSTDNLPLPADYKYGTHGDLKPENILLYLSPTDSRGILVVADLGLARLNSVMSKTQTNSRTPGTPRYKPPECSIFRASVKRNYDIWTFGCLLLEWVCWAFEGDDARGEFMESLFAPFPSGSQADMFFDMVNFEDGMYDVIVKPKVVEKLTNLHKSARCTQYFHDLLYLIEEEMIVVRNIHRSDSGTVHRKLSEMQSSMMRNEKYYTKHCNMPRVANQQAPLKAEFKHLSHRDK